MSKQLGRPEAIQTRLRDALLLLGFFAVTAFFYWRLNPEFIRQWQKPEFFLEWRFAKMILNRPGGLLEYLAAFFTETFLYRLWGALFLAAVTTAVLWVTRRVILKSTPFFAAPIFYAVPACCIIVLTSLYNHPLEETFSFLTSLAALDGYLYLQKQSARVRTFAALWIAVFLYLVASAALLFFALWVTLYETLHRRNLLSLSLLPVALFWIAWADRYIFLQNPNFAFLHLLPFHHTYKLAFAPYLLYAFLPFLVVVAIFVPKERVSPIERSKVLRLVQAVVVWGLAAAAAVFSFSQFHFDIQQVDKYAANRQWRDLLKYVEKRPITHRLILFQIYRALYHQGILLDELFSVSRQERALKSLMMDKDFAMTARLEYADLLMDFGHLNEAEHWTHEALVHFGQAPEVLVRMAQINLVKGNKAFADMCLRRLSKTLFYRDESSRLRAVLESNAPKLPDSYLEGVRRVMFRKDFPQFTYRVRVNLELMHQNNPENRMVFEYLCAYYLLSGNLKALMSCVEKFPSFRFQRLPRHIEEAAVLYNFMTRNPKPEVAGYRFSRDTIRRFSDYMQILAAHKGEREAAMPELKSKYGNTFWYYQMYVLRKLIEEQEKPSSEELS